MTTHLYNSGMSDARNEAGSLSFSRALVYATVLAGALDATDGVVFFGLHGLNRSRCCSTSPADCWERNPSAAALPQPASESSSTSPSRLWSLRFTSSPAAASRRCGRSG